MTVVVTRDVEPRYRGYLASVMLEIAPGVYTAPYLTKGVRDRVWTTLRDWYAQLGRGTIVMTWRSPGASGGQAVQTLGEPPRTLIDHEGVLLVKR